MQKPPSVKSIVLSCAAAFLLAACGQKTEIASAQSEPEASAPAPAESAAPDYAAIAAAAVSDPGRPEEDRGDDERRKPEQALEFFQVTPGAKVFEIEAGAGWFTELFSHAVGEAGSVIMQNPIGFRAYVGDQIDTRLADHRLKNVRESYSNFDKLDAPDGGIDLATWVWGPHELYYKPESGPLGDPTAAYAEIYRILKPGAAFVVIDHAAQGGAPETTGNDLHRVDKAIVIDMAQQAGFTLEAESDFLINSDDPLTVAVFDPSIRGHTSQFALRFRKPN